MLERKKKEGNLLGNLLGGHLFSYFKLPEGGAPIFRPWAALIVGAVAALLVLIAIPILDRLRVDDPTETFASHGICGLWGLLAIGLFPERDHLLDYTHGRSGLFVGGDWGLLLIQSVAAGCIIAWAVVMSVVLLIVSREVSSSSVRNSAPRISLKN